MLKFLVLIVMNCEISNESSASRNTAQNGHQHLMSQLKCGTIKIVKTKLSTHLMRKGEEFHPELPLKVSIPTGESLCTGKDISGLDGFFKPF